MKNIITRKVDELGRNLIPREIKKELNIKEGDLMQLSVSNGKIIAEKSMKTNADRIRKMSDEELAEFLKEFEKEICEDVFCRKLCDKRIDGHCTVPDNLCCPYVDNDIVFEWLQSESED